MHEARSSWILHFVPLPRGSFRMTMMRLCPLRLTMTHPRYCHPESAASGRRIHNTEAAWMHEARSSWILHFVPLPRDSFRMTMIGLECLTTACHSDPAAKQRGRNLRHCSSENARCCADVDSSSRSKSGGTQNDKDGQSMQRTVFVTVSSYCLLFTDYCLPITANAGILNSDF